MRPDLVRQVWLRAQARCEYCRLPKEGYPLPFHIDHVTAKQHGGTTVLENLALACLHCNRHKGPNIAGRHPVTGELVRLFNPRIDDWSQHFEWQGEVLLGKTDVGQVTIHVLSMNAPDFLEIRIALKEEGVFPPG